MYASDVGSVAQHLPTQCNIHLMRDTRCVRAAPTHREVAVQVGSMNKRVCCVPATVWLMPSTTSSLNGCTVLCQPRAPA